jgi:hypothetical protein
VEIDCSENDCSEKIPEFFWLSQAVLFFYLLAERISQRNKDDMTISTTINSEVGLVSTINDEDQGIVKVTGLQFPITNLTTATTISAKQAGAFTIGNGSAAVTYVMPLASSCPGSLFTFRNTTAYANALTCSQEANGTLAFTDGENRGSKLAIQNAVGSSIALISDGKSFLLIGASGSGAISGT